MKFLKENWLTLLLIAGILVLAYYGLFKTDSREYKKAIKQYEHITDSLQKENKKIAAEKDTIISHIAIANIAIGAIENHDAALLSKIDGLEQKIITLNKRYEETTSRFARYNSDSIRVYFAGL